MRNRRRTRILRRLVLGLAVAATVVPAAQARVDGSSDWSGIGKARSVDTRNEPIAVVRASDYKRYWSPQGAQPANQYAGYVRALPGDYATVGGGQPVHAASEPNGFHWRDGLVGALAALGLALLAFAALLGTQRPRAATA
jgi:hypothetical protein